MKKLALSCLLLCCFACQKDDFEWYYPFAYRLLETKTDIHYYYINDNNKLSEIPASGSFIDFEKSSQDQNLHYKLLPQALKFVDKTKVLFTYDNSSEGNLNYALKDSIITIELVDGIGDNAPLFDFKIIETDSNRVWLEQGFLHIRYSFRKKSKQKYENTKAFALLQEKPLTEAMNIWKKQALKVRDTIAIYTTRHLYKEE
jgi:hypothetical protein